MTTSHKTNMNNKIKTEINKLLQKTYYDIEKGEPEFDPTFEPGVLEDIMHVIEKRYPKRKVKPFNVKEFRKDAKELQKAVAKEEKKYGKMKV